MSIPVRLRAKLGLLEGSKVSVSVNGNSLVLSPNGQGSVTASIGVCGTPGPSSNLGSGPSKNRGKKYE